MLAAAPLSLESFAAAVASAAVGAAACVGAGAPAVAPSATLDGIDGDSEAVASLIPE